MVLSKREINGMRAAGKIAAEILEEISSIIKPGISTLEIDEFAEEITQKKGAISAPYQYQPTPNDTPFPGHICTSINNEVCHSFPRKDVILKEGDIINCDVTPKYKGFHGDTSKTFLVGEVDEKAKKLVEITEKAMYIGIDAIKAGRPLKVIGTAIEEFIKPFGYSIVRELCGHGIGRQFHTEPDVFHYRNNNSFKLKENACITVEPMINYGKRHIKVAPDNWTIVTKDGSLSAQFEHTVLITNTGYEILTTLEDL